MLFIAHRINTISQLKEIPKEFGVEIDLRDREGVLILQHDPFKEGENFSNWLKHYSHAFLICNIKSEGIEFKVLETLNMYGISNFFFLDSSIPMIMKLIKTGEKRIAIRYSEVEPLSNLETEWLWVDCFTKYPVIPDNLINKYKICLVGPTLQSHDWKIEESWKQYTAVCDKVYNYKNYTPGS